MSRPLPFVPWTVAAGMVRDGDPGAMAFLDEALRSLPPDQGGSHRLRMRFDRVQVLLDRSEAAAVLAEVRAREAEGVTHPPYVARAAADALRASGPDGELGTRDHRLTTRLVSPPLGDRLRFRVATTRERRLSAHPGFTWRLP